MKFLSIALILLQNQDKFLFASDKIWTVLVVLLVIFGVILSMLLLLERRVRKVEKRADEIESNRNINATK